MTMVPCSSRTFLNTPNPLLSSPSNFRSLSFINLPFSLCTKGKPSTASRPLTVVTATPMASEQSSVKEVDSVPDSTIKLLFVEMGVGYDQHGQDITSAATRACRDAISSNSIPAFRRGSIPGVSFGEMKLQIKLGVPRPLQHLLDIEKVKSVFPYGTISNVEVVDGGLICSSGVHVEEMGDKNDDCYIVNAAVYVGY
ncbi:UNVERIFIED_CONTAM: hypothetical protein Scaly_1300000 [Sesamum calycinum]|uniref:50S ribosomal protein L34 n=1 Tax=Sesamum calycinum TaxID=2727403 RepID=A0AAW2Q6L5_9LAMI